MRQMLNARWLLALFLTCALSAESTPGASWTQWQPLIGGWIAVSADGVPGKPSDGGCSFSLELNGAIIVRKNHAAYPATNDRPAMVHDDLIMIFRRGDAVRAVYCDSEGHEIDYAASYSATDKIWTFISESGTGAPRYRLTYLLVSPREMSLKFELAPPGQPDAFKTYINAVLRRADTATAAAP